MSAFTFLLISPILHKDKCGQKSCPGPSCQAISFGRPWCQQEEETFFKWFPLTGHPFAIHRGISSLKICVKGTLRGLRQGWHSRADSTEDNLFSCLENCKGACGRSQLRPMRENSTCRIFPSSSRGPGSRTTTRRCITLTVASAVGGDKRHSLFQ